VLIRTWNVFHGNTSPPKRRAFPADAVRLAVEDDPDVVCLQELPAWSLPRLTEWSGYDAVSVLAQPPTLGPLPSTAVVGRALTSLHPGHLRSAFAGQGNAILVSPRLAVRDRHVCRLNPRSFRRAQTEWLGLGPLAQLAWAKERRVCQAVRLWDGSRTILVANLHATSYPPEQRLPDAELLRAFRYVEGLAQPGEPVAVAGDFNVSFARSRTLLDLTRDGWESSRIGPGIDHILVRDLEIVSGPTTWPLERREFGGAVLSDHAPVDLEVE
jgi:endonuclease/exonuclease/phosphatase family metal-dependent hydrolase